MLIQRFFFRIWSPVNVLKSYTLYSSYTLYKVIKKYQLIKTEMKLYSLLRVLMRISFNFSKIIKRIISHFHYSTFHNNILSKICIGEILWFNHINFAFKVAEFKKLFRYQFFLYFRYVENINFSSFNKSGNGAFKNAIYKNCSFLNFSFTSNAENMNFLSFNRFEKELLIIWYFLKIL